MKKILTILSITVLIVSCQPASPVDETDNTPCKGDRVMKRGGMQVTEITVSKAGKFQAANRKI